MELLNSTAVPAKLIVTTRPDRRDQRIGLIVAKASFSLASGRARLDVDLADPIFDDDTIAEDGLLPNDMLPRRAEGLEVIVLARAETPDQRPTSRIPVEFVVGDHQRKLLVFGDRQWVCRFGRWMISEALPFRTMALDWSRAHGGRAEVWIDKNSVIEVADPINRRGRGFDPIPLAEGLCRQLDAPSGYPVVPRPRMLPNIEDPAGLIRRPEDAPLPACWATIPCDVGIGMVRRLHAIERGDSAGDEPAREALAVYHRAHPAWFVPSPKAGARVWWSGLRSTIRGGFRLPALRVLADTLVGEKVSQLELRPQVLVVRPDLGRIQITYRARFRVSAPGGVARRMRLRLAEEGLR